MRLFAKKSDGIVGTKTRISDEFALIDDGVVPGLYGLYSGAVSTGILTMDGGDEPIGLGAKLLLTGAANAPSIFGIYINANEQILGGEYEPVGKYKLRSLAAGAFAGFVLVAANAESAEAVPVAVMGKETETAYTLQLNETPSVDLPEGIIVDIR